MATFDRAQGHVVVRVVYDGASGAGKTANLQHLVQTFSAQRRGELYSPDTTDATRWFDWLYFNGGVVGGHPLRAQLVTTPGGLTLTRRRWQLVEKADVIVFVCESTPSGIERGRVAFALLRARLASRRLAPPILIQASQRDAADARPVEAIAAALDITEPAEIVRASTVDGTGVRETVVLAIRSAAAIAERQIVAAGAESLAPAEDGPTLLGLLDGSARLRDLLGLDSPPRLPLDDLPTSDVWPTLEGPRLLRSLGRSLAAAPIRSLRASSGSHALRIGDHYLKGRLLGVPSGSAGAHSELTARARECVMLGRLHAPETTFALAPSADGSVWLWRVAPWTTPLAEKMALADSAGDEREITRAFEQYAYVVAEAARVARDGRGPKISPTHFGEIGGRLVYLSDRFVSSSTNGLVEAASVIARFKERWPRAAAAYARALAGSLSKPGAVKTVPERLSGRAS